MSHTSHVPRGMTLLETLLAMGIFLGVMGWTSSFYVRSTQGFYEANTQSYVQGGVRRVVDRIGADCRAAQALLTSATIGNTVYTASDGTHAPACLILSVPAQDADGPFFYASSESESGMLVTDTVVYRYNPDDQTLRCSVLPATKVPASTGKRRSSNREAQTETVLARNVAGLTFTFRDKDGTALSSLDGTDRAATVDVSAQLAGVSNRATLSAISVTRIRLRNMHSGGIFGTVDPATSGASVQAIVNVSGAYAAGTPLGSATTDADGFFAIGNLVDGTYHLRITTLDKSVTEPSTTYSITSEQSLNAGNVAIH